MKGVKSIKTDWNEKTLELRISISLLWFLCGILVIIWFPYFPEAWIINVNSFAISLEGMMSMYITILAIVPGISLAVAGIVTSAYGYKTLDIFGKDRYFWFLIILCIFIFVFGYLLSIFSVYDQRWLLTFQSISIVGIFFLIPYFIASIRLMRFDEIVDRYVSELKRESFLPILFQDRPALHTPGEDPFLVLRDFMVKAIDQRDLGSFNIVLTRYTNAVIELIEDICKNPQEYNPKWGKTQFDELIGEESSQDLWTGSTIQKLEETVLFHHLESVKEHAFRHKNEEVLREIVVAVGRLGRETWPSLYSISKYPQATMGDYCSIYIMKIGREATKHDMIDLLTVCFNEEGKIGKFFAKNTPRGTMNDVSLNCIKNIDQLFLSFMNDGKFESVNLMTVLTGALNNQIDIITSRMMYLPHAVSSYDFEGLKKIIGVARVDQLLPFDIIMEKLIIPIILHMEMENGVESVRDVAMLMNRSFIRKEDLWDYYKITIDRLQHTDMPWQRMYGNDRPDDWYEEFLEIANIFVREREDAPDLARPRILNNICSKLLIFWIKTKNWKRIKEILTLLTSKYKPSEESGRIRDYRYFIDTLDWCSFALLKIGEKDTFVHALSCLDKIADRDPSKVSEISQKIAECGIDAVRLKRAAEKNEIVKSLVSLAIKPYKGAKYVYRGGIQTSFLAEIAGVIPRDRYLLYSRMDLEGGFYLEKIFDGDYERESFKSIHAKVLLEEYTTALVIFAHDQARELKDNMKM